MAYTLKFQNMANAARARVDEVLPEHVDALMAKGAIALDIRDREEHDIDHISGSLNISRGKLEMLIESEVPNMNTIVLCYCNVNNRGALSADTLRGMGYENAKFIVGGLLSYRALG
jgi:rhodanese-related sulfurtransferase